MLSLYNGNRIKCGRKYPALHSVVVNCRLGNAPLHYCIMRSHVVHYQILMGGVDNKYAAVPFLPGHSIKGKADG